MRFCLIAPPTVPPYILSLVPFSTDSVLAGRDRDRRVADRVHAGVAEEHVGRAAQRVGARLHVQADQAAEAVAVLGIDAVLGDRDFLDGVHRRRVGGLVARAERDAIEQDGVGAARAAAGVVVVGVGVVVRAVLGGRRPGRVDDGRIEVGQVVRVAPADRHLVDQRALERRDRSWLELNCTSGDEPWTVMVSATVASPISRSMVTSPRCGTRTAFCEAERNPCSARGDGVVCSRIDEIEPIAPLARRVTRSVATPVASFRSVTVAPGSAPRLSSRHLPLHARPIILRHRRSGEPDHCPNDSPASSTTFS